MDKTFFSCKEERVCEEGFDGKRGTSAVIYSLLCLLVAFTFMNAAIRLYATEQAHSKVSEAVVAFSEGVLRDDAVFASAQQGNYADEEIR